MKLTLDFAPPRRPWWHWLPAAVALLCLAAILVQLTKEQAELEKAQASHASLDAHVRRLERQSAQARQSSAAQRDAAAAAQSIAAALAYPWGEELAVIERADLAEVALFSLAQAQEERRGELVVEARDADSLNTYAARLNSTAVDGRWYITLMQAQPDATAPRLRATVKFEPVGKR
ncbi:hypothetical protein [Pseudoduganella armeniaca]|uniref:Uncharacterized protein n=1 Tax=Pseudoduganella armeniaca TaxID=2072590 RepID=A0A2R4CAV0_9BURK|nr:hypothetical protein [Pseudoduganella armeniaca]AVR96630.1 hypothetical protein C9I28_13705 [Pseudoduganella armeniaca]